MFIEDEEDDGIVMNPIMPAGRESGEVAVSKRFLIIGETGAGKTNTVNELCGTSYAVSDSAIGTTFSFQKAICNIPGECGRIELVDTVGLSEGINGKVHPAVAFAKLVALVKDSKNGFNGIFLVVGGPKVTKTMQENYRLFVEQVTQNKVPCYLFINKQEFEDYKTQYHRNLGKYESSGFEFAHGFAGGFKQATVRLDTLKQFKQCIAHAPDIAKALYTEDGGGLFSFVKRMWSHWKKFWSDFTGLESKCLPMNLLLGFLFPWVSPRPSQRKWHRKSRNTEVCRLRSSVSSKRSWNVSTSRTKDSLKYRVRRQVSNSCFVPCANLQSFLGSIAQWNGIEASNGGASSSIALHDLHHPGTSPTEWHVPQGQGKLFERVGCQIKNQAMIWYDGRRMKRKSQKPIPNNLFATFRYLFSFLQSLSHRTKIIANGSENMHLPISFVTSLGLTFLDQRRTSLLRNSFIEDGHDGIGDPIVDNRPFEQRTTGRRQARRMNHAFRYLYRHDFRGSNTSSALEYLTNEGGLSHEHVLRMNESFPILLSLSPSRQLHPKLQFLKQTLNITNPSSISHILPPQYFGARLERVLAPHHAFLVWLGLPFGRDLFQIRSVANPNQTLFEEFMKSGRNSKSFAALCQSWLTNFPATAKHNNTPSIITPRHVDAFDTIFSRGLMAAARNELAQQNNTWATDMLPSLQASDMLRLLIQHGANPHERDHRGATLLHWACGVGHWEGARALLRSSSCHTTVWDRTVRDGATPLHWAAAGATAREFGVGGHAHVCERLLLEHVVGSNHRTAYVNCCTYDGNSALMWASWSGTLATVKLLARHRADTRVANRNGCTVAHWAASGGNLPVCQYLADTMGVDFTIPNNGGNTPLTHAVAFGRSEIVEWLLDRFAKNGEDQPHDDVLALSLAQDFVEWTGGSDDRRKKVLDLFTSFEDW